MQFFVKREREKINNNIGFKHKHKIAKMNYRDKLGLPEKIKFTLKYKLLENSKRNKKNFENKNMKEKNIN